MINCKICNKDTKYKTMNQFYQRHLKTEHNIDLKQYYTKFFLKDNENVCKTCGKESLFFNFEKGYHPYCSKSCAARNPETTRKYKETMLERHGVENVYQMESTKENIKKTCLEKYGVDNPAKNTDIIEKIKEIKRTNYKADFEASLSKKYMSLIDKDNYLSSKPFRIKCELCNNVFTSKKGIIYLINCDKCKKTFKSRYEKEITLFLQEYGLICLNNKRFNKKELDIYIPSKNIGIEFNGHYWHSELVVNKEYHQEKYEHFKDLDIPVIQIMEGEWLNKKEIVKSIILSKLGIYKERVFARKCIVKEISSTVYREFLEENHLQGICNSSIRKGLFYNNELLSCIGIGKSRFEKNTRELHRYCTKKNIQIIGGFSKLIKSCSDISNLTTYCDLRYSSGEIYLNNGFKYIHKTKPNFYYYHKSNPLVLYNRQKFQKHKLKDILDIFDSNKSEEENMYLNDFIKIYDAGCYKFKINCE